MKRLICMLLAVFLFGCSAAPSFTEKVTLYYPSADAPDNYGQLIVQLPLEGSGKTAEEVLDTYFSKNDNPLIVPFPAGVSISSLKQKENHVTLMLSDEFASLSGIDLTKACICICKTISDLTGVSTVTIGCRSALIDGEQSITFTPDSVLWLDEGFSSLPTDADTQPTQ